MRNQDNQGSDQSALRYQDTIAVTSDIGTADGSRFPQTRLTQPTVKTATGICGKFL